MGAIAAFVLARWRRMKDANDELALQDAVRKIESQFNAGTEPPSKDTPGRVYYQRAAGSYLRTWWKDADGNWW